MWCANRICACRRELNSQNAAEPRENSHLPLEEFTMNSLAKSKLAKCRGQRVSRDAANKNCKDHSRSVERPHCVGNIGSQLVQWPAATSNVKFGGGWLSHRQALVARQGLQRGAGSFHFTPPRITSSWQVRPHRMPRAALPNPSLKLSPNSVARRPSSARPSAYFALAVQRAMPSSPP